MENKNYDFPLDRFLDYKNKAYGTSTSDRALKSAASQNLSMKKRIHQLAEEAEKITQQLAPVEFNKDTPKSSSTSLIESESSSYIERLVETKFKEVTFKNVGKNNQSNSKGAQKNPLPYYPKLFEEKNSEAIHRQELPPHILHVPKEREVSGISKCRGCSRNNFEKRDIIDSKPSSRSGKINKPCNCHVKGILSNRSEEKEKSVRGKNNGDGRSVSQTSGLSRSQTFVVKNYRTVSVETEKPETYNTTIVNMRHIDEEVGTESFHRGFTVQEMPKVNIRPNLTKQSGPKIDISVPKYYSRKNNVAVVEYVHPDVLQENKIRSSILCSRIKSREAEESQKSLNIHPSRKTNKEVKLQHSLKEMLKKLDNKIPNVDRLRNSLNLLIGMLNKVVPFHTASIRLQSDHIPLFDESIDLFFTNLDIVQEVVENELKNPVERFCRHPEYIIKAINLLCGNIRSIFDISDDQPSSVKSSIKDSIENNKGGRKSTVESENKKPKNLPLRPSSKKVSKAPANVKTLDPEIIKENIVPTNVYIPYRKLTPGGMFKEMEEAETLSEIELRRRRLEKIHEINKNLRSGLGQKSKNNTPENSSQENPQEIFNRTFIIESDNENEAVRKPLSKTGTEVTKKSEADYEEDWEQELATSDSRPGPEGDGSLEMKSLVVEAQVHVREQNDKSLTVNSSQSTNHDELSELESISKIQKGETSSNQRNEEKNNFASIAIQTDNIEVKTNVPNVPKINEATNNAAPILEAYPVLRMTNPLTKALLEVRMPETTESFQSSLHFQKSENKEEIKLSYKTFKGKNNSINITEEEIIVRDESVSKKEVSVEKESVQNERVKPTNSDLEHITLDFVGFLEKKVTEMVNKFKLSETNTEKLLTGKKTPNQEIKIVQHSTLNKESELLNSEPMQKFSMYKSTSSLFSDKSNDELVFFKNVTSRGCTPESGFVKFDSLVSPPLALKLKKDEPTQTECFKGVETVDACVGTSEITRMSNEQSKPEIKIKQIIQHDLLSPDQGLRWANQDSGPEEYPYQRRLLPLPEDVLMSNSSVDSNQNKKEHNTSSNTYVLSPTKIPQIRDKPNKDVLESEAGEESSNEKFEEETAILVSKAEGTDGGDSQRTSQIFNFSITNEPSTQTPNLTQESTDQKQHAGSLENLNVEELIFGPKYSKNINKIKQAEFSHSLMISGNDGVGVELSSDNEKISDAIAGQIGSPIRQIEANEGSRNASNEDLIIEEISSEDTSVHNPSTVKIKSPMKKSKESEEEVVENNLQNTPSQFNKKAFSIHENQNIQEMEEIIEQSSTMERNVEPQGSQENENDASYVNDDFEDYSSSELSENCITIYHYNSDDMSEGEIGFAYTSHSYSSGEIKPLCLDKSPDHVPEESDEKSLKGTNKEEISPVGLPKQLNNSPSETDSLASLAEGVKFDYDSATPNLDSSTDGSISTGELQHLLDDASLTLPRSLEE